MYIHTYIHICICTERERERSIAEIMLPAALPPRARWGTCCRLHLHRDLCVDPGFLSLTIRERGAGTRFWILNPIINPIIHPIITPIINPIINPLITPIITPIINPIINPIITLL